MRRFQEIRYEKLGLSLFARVNSYSFEKAQIMIALSDQKERISAGGFPPEGWASNDALTAIDRILQGLRHGDYELVMPTLKEKRQIKEDGIAIHRALVELVAYCLNRSSVFAYGESYKWTCLAESLTNEIHFIVKLL